MRPLCTLWFYFLRNLGNFTLKILSAMRYFILCILIVCLLPVCSAQKAQSPYPESTYITGVDFHFNTIKTAAKGSDIWPVTWAANNKLYTAWGDGKGFSGKEKVSWGIATLKGTPENWIGENIFYGPAGSGKGKISGLLAIGNTLYAWKNTQNRKYPWCDIILIKSTNGAKSWKDMGVKFGQTGFKPASFINYGRGYDGAKDRYVYAVGFKAGEPEHNIYLVRVAKTQLGKQSAYEYFSGTNRKNQVIWKKDQSLMAPIFKGISGNDYFPFPVIIYNAGLKRYIFTDCHGTMGKIDLFESTNPWGPWKTIYYSNHWGNLTEGEYLGFEFPNKWASADGRKLGMIFSVYDSDNTQWNDACNTMIVTLIIR